MTRASSRSRSPAKNIADDQIKFGPGGYDFSAPEQLPQSVKERAHELLESGRLFRYQGGVDDVAELERVFSKYIELPFTMACNSGGCGLFLAVKALGVKPGDKVLLNAWTLAPVPGSIVHACASPVFVDVHPHDLTIDVEDLEAKAKESGAKVLMLSYMRGQIPNMDKVMAAVKRCGLLLIEDCAHTLGAKWKLDDGTQKHIGTFGDVAVWSMQTNKSVNAGEGGLISTARQDIAGFVTVATGSYGHYAMNGASGSIEHLKDIYTDVPNFSMRLTTLAAAIARPQLENLPAKLASWERHAHIIRKHLQGCPHVRTVSQDLCMEGKLTNVWSSIQFELVDFSADMVADTLKRLLDVGITMAWFGGPCKGFTSTLRDWKFADPQGQRWKAVETMSSTLKTLVDLPLYHTTSWGDAVIVKLAETITKTITAVAAETPK